MSTDTSITTLDPQQLSLVLRPSENSRVTEEDRTLGLYESSIAGMQSQIRELASKNRTLCTALVTQEGQHREIEVLHTAEITALQEKVKTSEDAAEAMRKEMQDTMQKAHKMVQAALAEKTAAVQLATRYADARVAAAKQEAMSQASAARQTSESQIHASYARQREARVRETHEIADDIATVLNSAVDWRSESREVIEAFRHRFAGTIPIQRTVVTRKSPRSKDGWVPEDQAKDIKVQIDPLIDKLKRLT